MGLRVKSFLPPSHWLIFCPLGPDPWIRIFLRIQRIRTLSTVDRQANIWKKIKNGKFYKVKIFEINTKSRTKINIQIKMWNPCDELKVFTFWTMEGVCIKFRFDKARTRSTRRTWRTGGTWSLNQVHIGSQNEGYYSWIIETILTRPIH